MCNARAAKSKCGARGCNAEKIVGIQTCPADQSAVDVRLREQFAGVARLDAAAVQNADLRGGFIIVSLGEQPAKISVDFGRLLRTSDFSGADRPNRFVSDYCFRNIVRRNSRQRAFELTPNDGPGLSSFAFGQ